MSYGAPPAGFMQQQATNARQAAGKAQPSTFGAPAGGGEGGAKMSISGGQSSSRDFFSDPAQAARLSALMEGLIGGAGQDYLEFIRNPTASPYFQNAYEGILAALAPQETQQRQALQDTFRAAGGGAGMGGGAYGVAAGQLEGEINRNQMAGLTQLLTTLFPQVTNALFAPISETDAIMNAMKLQESESNQFSFSGDITGAGGLSDRYNPNFSTSALRKNLRPFTESLSGLAGSFGDLF